MHHATPCPSSSTGTSGTEDDFENCLPGFRLTHILNVVSGPDLDIVDQILDCIKDEQASVSNWTIVRRGDLLDQRISLQGTSEQRVRSVREQLLRLDKGLRIRLEHQFNRQRHSDVKLSAHP
ncbi:hypothetical protein [Paraburkholderia sp. SIMBA_030]|uniref:hypothetical protein n=1 Tax=Paraburkholderia sp. SIMBA_030 TaxID=3085773 RepID=UPI0039783BD1